MGRNIYNNPSESDIEKYRELKKVMIRKTRRLYLQDLC